jgi:Arc/MetJ-type ribon-helix-helix transcriptional regulator
MTYSHTRRLRLAKAKPAITLDEATLGRVDKLVRRAMFANRSQAIQKAVEENLARLERSRLARESAKLDPAFEKALAEEGLREDVSEWPAY